MYNRNKNTSAGGFAQTGAELAKAVVKFFGRNQARPTLDEESYPIAKGEGKNFWTISRNSRRLYGLLR